MNITAKSFFLPALLSAAFIIPNTSDACTRFIYHGNNDLHMTARSMDWAKPAGTNLWIFPGGMHRQSTSGKQGLQWTSRYGSVITSAYDMATTDGMNEKGLSANLLWLTETTYPEYHPKQKMMPVSVWAQYVLDNFATVKDAVNELRNERFIVLTDKEPGRDRLVKLHLSISDATGDSAIIEYIDGELTIHQGRDTDVMTNSPVFNEQLALNRYLEETNGYVVLPGSRRSTDRFVRAKFYGDRIPVNLSPDEALAAVLSVIRNASSPYRSATEPHSTVSGVIDEKSSTRLRSVADHRHNRYFFDSVMAPAVIWIDLNEIDFSAGTGRVKKLNLGDNQQHLFTGNVTNDFIESDPFEFADTDNQSVLYFGNGKE